MKKLDILLIIEKNNPNNIVHIIFFYSNSFVKGKKGTQLISLEDINQFSID